MSNSEFVYGFNLGQIHHFAQMIYNQQGYIPDSLIERMKKEIPASMLHTCRMSGTMSNQWALDLPGYNNLKHDIQVENNKNVSSPEKSYIYPFVDFYNKMGFKECIWTVNTISAWSNPNERELWEKRLFGALRYIIDNGVNVTRICLENEMWMYPECVYMHNGSRSSQDLLKYGSSILNNRTFETNTKRTMRSFISYLQEIHSKLKVLYPNIKYSVSVDTSNTQRSRWLNDVLREFNFYDAVTPHIYIQSTSTKDTINKVNAKINPVKTAFPKKEIWVTESNWQYPQDDSTKSWGVYHDTLFRKDLHEAIKSTGAKLQMFHTIWSGRSSYGWLPL